MTRLSRTWLFACSLPLVLGTGCGDDSSSSTPAGSDSGAAGDAAGGTDIASDASATSADSSAATDSGTASDAQATDGTATTDTTATDTTATDGGATDDSSARTDSATADASVPAAPSCETYCETVMANCTGANAQYKDAAACLFFCKTGGKLPVGTVDDKGGNSVGCRTYHAGAAKSDPSMHCSHAGPGGDNVCGTWCENYCHLAQANCAGDLALYGKAEDCAAACATANTGGKVGDASGDTLQCRMYHLTVAGTDLAAAKTHCPHGKLGKEPGLPCSPAVVAPTTVKVVTSGFAFSPDMVMIKAGDKVEFTLPANHNAVEVDEATWNANGSTPKSGGFSVGFGETKTLTFDKAGTYYFVCSPHAGMKMKGQIMVN